MDQSPNETTAPAPKAKRPKRANRRRAAAAPPKPATVPKEFEGISVTECCDGCNADRCIISGKPYCAHPAKGGLHSADLMNPEAVQRYKRAKRVLGEAKLNLQG